MTRYQSRLLPGRPLVADQEVQNIPAIGTLRLIQLRVAALTAAYGNKLLILYIKNLCEVTACGLKLVALIILAAAFRANVLSFFQDPLPRFLHIDASHYSRLF